MAPFSEERPLILDDLLRIRASDEEQVPVLACPHEGTRADFELFTARDLDLFVDRAAKGYLAIGLTPARRIVVSLIAPSNLDYFITLFALSRLGYAVLLISPRLAPEACNKLIKETGSHIIVNATSGPSLKLTQEAQVEIASLVAYPMMGKDIYRNDARDHQPRFMRTNVDREVEKDEPGIIYHSSGSTGLPKSIPAYNIRLLSPLPKGVGSRDLTTSPLYHAYASKLTISSINRRRCMYLTGADMALTTEGLVTIMKQVVPNVFFTVPYVLKLLSESRQGIEALKTCSEVVSSGSTLSDELGNRLIEEGVNVEILFAGTEPGMVGTSMGRPPGDMAWDYIRLPPAVHQHMQFKPLGDNTFEFVFLSTLPTLCESNSDDPPGSFHSKDIFTPHSSIPHAWKYHGRIDDRVTLSNGEKVLPLPIEGRVREEPLVRDAVVFGVDRAVPGLLVLRADAAAKMSDDHFLSAIWPAVEAANASAEGFSQISKDMIVCLPAGVEAPSADKGNIIRAKMYKAFASEIDAVYTRSEQAAIGALKYDLPELETYITKLIKDDLATDIEGPTRDFHQAGMDSLRAIRLRSLIIKNVDIGDKVLPPNVVFDTGNVQRLARYISSPMSQFDDGNSLDGVPRIESLIERYSIFEKHVASPGTKTKGSVVVLTGATGSLGSHLLSQLVVRNDVAQVYCLVRGEKPADRVQQALRARCLKNDILSPKVTVFASDLRLPDFGLTSADLDRMLNTVTHIVHAAWSVNFQLGLDSFEPEILGLHNLLQLSLSVHAPDPAKLFFCSSISAALATPAPAVIEEAPISDFNHALDSGYARSKLVGEHLVAAAVAEAGGSAYVLRIGQIVGDTRNGIWNDSQAPPLMIRSALTLKTLPALDVVCSWIPVDTLASSIIEIALDCKDIPEGQTWNLENPKTFHWTRDLLPVLRNAGLQFDTVKPAEWLQQLRHYHETTSAEEALTRNPAVKLLDHFESSYGDENLRVNGAADNRNSSRQDSNRVTFDTRRAQVDSVSLRNAPDVLAQGLVGKYLGVWLDKWLS
ncbi:hypothetical protein LTR66_012495 [Elasticomyces elasticus]|nr:hypothetical protein LTR66_012495 [Elasticomyces elasticus]